MSVIQINGSSPLPREIYSFSSLTTPRKDFIICQRDEELFAFDLTSQKESRSSWLPSYSKDLYLGTGFQGLWFWRDPDLLCVSKGQVVVTFNLPNANNILNLRDSEKYVVVQTDQDLLICTRSEDTWLIKKLFEVSNETYMDLHQDHILWFDQNKRRVNRFHFPSQKITSFSFISPVEGCSLADGRFHVLRRRSTGERVYEVYSFDSKDFSQELMKEEAKLVVTPEGRVYFVKFVDDLDLMFGKLKV
jgi:hypothetical protein